MVGVLGVVLGGSVKAGFTIGACEGLLSANSCRLAPSEISRKRLRDRAKKAWLSHRFYNGVLKQSLRVLQAAGLFSKTGHASYGFRGLPAVAPSGIF